MWYISFSLPTLVTFPDATIFQDVNRIQGNNAIEILFLFLSFITYTLSDLWRAWTYPCDSDPTLYKCMQLLSDLFSHWSNLEDSMVSQLHISLPFCQWSRHEAERESSSTCCSQAFFTIAKLMIDTNKILLTSKSNFCEKLVVSAC